MSDRLIRAMTRDGFVKITAVDTTEITRRAREIHHTTAVATAALGRVLTAASMIGNMQKKDDGSITLIIKGGGPLGTLLATADPEGNPRGYVENPQIALMEKYQGKLDVGAAVGGEGTLTLIRDLHMKEPYVGTVELLGGEIAEDVASYFVESEQVPTVCALGVLLARDQSVEVAGGYLLQLMPGAPEELIDRLEQEPSPVLCSRGRDLRRSSRQSWPEWMWSSWRSSRFPTNAAAPGTGWSPRLSVWARRSSEKSLRRGRISP